MLGPIAPVEMEKMTKLAGAKSMTEVRNVQKAPLPPLIPGKVLSREERMERMFTRYAKTFEALAK